MERFIEIGDGGNGGNVGDGMKLLRHDDGARRLACRCDGPYASVKKRFVQSVRHTTGWVVAVLGL